MRKISTKVKEIFSFSKGDTKLPYNECLKMLTALRDINHAAVSSNGESSIIDEKTYLLAIKDCCIQFEILIEAEVEEDFLSSQTTISDPIVSRLETIKENIAYNKIAKSSQFVRIDMESKKAVYEKDGDFFEFNPDSISLNDNKTYFKALSQFCTVAASIDNLQFNRSVDQNPQLDFSLISNEFKEIGNVPYIEKRVDLSEVVVLENTVVRLVRPVLKKDKRLKWTIAFNPILPENLVLQGTHDYEAYVKDDEFISWSASDSNPGYKNGDAFICDITYSVHHKSGDFFATIKDVVLNNVKKA